MCCKDKSGCRNPEKAGVSPEECSPEQVIECHGDVEGHPCAPGGRKGRKE